MARRERDSLEPSTTIQRQHLARLADTHGKRLPRALKSGADSSAAAPTTNVYPPVGQVLKYGISYGKQREICSKNVSIAKIRT